MFGNEQASLLVSNTKNILNHNILELSGYFGSEEAAEKAIEQIMSHLPNRMTPGAFEILIENMWLLYTINQFSHGLEQNQLRLGKSVLHSQTNICESRDSSHQSHP